MGGIEINLYKIRTNKVKSDFLHGLHLKLTFHFFLDQLCNILFFHMKSIFPPAGIADPTSENPPDHQITPLYNRPI